MEKVDLELIIDGDGHINEDIPAIAEFLPPLFQKNFPGRANIFPVLDHLHTPFKDTPANLTGRGIVGPIEWAEFLDDVGIDTTVLYPTGGLAYGRIVGIDRAIAVTRAYNDWLSETYLKVNPRVKGMALIPLQDPSTAVLELRRVVEELGFLGAMLPSTGLALPLGSKAYWPVYEEANRLGCCLSVHGGAHSGMGLDQMNNYVPVHALGHTFGQMISFGSIVFNGIFDMYQNLRIAFLEGGASWLIAALERFNSSHASHIEYRLDDNPPGPKPEEIVSDYVIRHIQAGKIFVGIEGDELGLGYTVDLVGSQPFIYSSDFPHEVTNETCKEEIQELLERTDLKDTDKAAILNGNAAKFYKLQPASKP